jgi:thioredoxin reductase (NADPH)
MGHGRPDAAADGRWNHRHGAWIGAVDTFNLPPINRTMLTIDEVRSIPLFATLPVAELERLAQRSADLHLAVGEFAVHEGGDRALYAVLAGKIEVVKLYDGIERTLGWRVPGTIFGEVPIAFGTVFVGTQAAGVAISQCGD